MTRRGLPRSCLKCSLPVARTSPLSPRGSRRQRGQGRWQGQSLYFNNQKMMFFLTLTLAQPQPQCPAFTFQSSQQCPFCPSSCLSCTSSQTCVSCVPGTFLESANNCVKCTGDCDKCASAASCDKCADGFLEIRGGCQACTLSNVVSCAIGSIVCKPGFFFNN
jgi:hypothetical protein